MVFISFDLKTLNKMISGRLEKSRDMKLYLEITQYVVYVYKQLGGIRKIWRKAINIKFCADQANMIHTYSHTKTQ